MIRASYIFLFSLATAFLFHANGTGLAMKSDIVTTEQSSAISNGTDYLNQDNSPFLFVYWDERVRTTLTEFREQNRQPSRVSIQLLRHLPPSYKCITDLGNAWFLSAEYSPTVTENYIVTLRKFRI